MNDIELADLAIDLRGTLTRAYLALHRSSPLEGISAPKAVALTTIADAGPMRMGELAERESIRTPSATALVDGLAEQGLVERQVDPKDRRVVMISVTPAGRALLDEIRRNRSGVLLHALQKLDAGQLTALAAAGPALGALKAALEER